MPPIAIRPFRRSDRDQLTRLVNAHVEAVLPGVTVSPNTVLSQLEREPGEYVVDPWVAQRLTLVAVLHERVVGGRAPAALRRRRAGRVRLPRCGRDPLATGLARPEPLAGRGAGDGRRRPRRGGARPPPRRRADRCRLRPARPRGLRRARPVAARGRGTAARGLRAGRTGGGRARREHRRSAQRRPRRRPRPGATGRARRPRHALLRGAGRRGRRHLRSRNRPHRGRHPLPPGRVGRRLGPLDRAGAPPPRHRDLAARARGRSDALRGRPAGCWTPRSSPPIRRTARTRSCAMSASASSRGPPAAGSWSSLPPCPATPSCCAGSTSGSTNASRWPICVSCSPTPGSPTSAPT